MNKQISQGIIIQDNKVLMVKQYVQRGDIVWNFPGGGIEDDETPEVACIREVKEETGYDVTIENLIHRSSNKFTFIANIIGGHLHLDSMIEDNADIIDVAWIDINDKDKFDEYTTPAIDLFSAIKQSL